MLPFITIQIIHFNFARTAYKYNIHTTNNTLRIRKVCEIKQLSYGQIKSAHNKIIVCTLRVFDTVNGCVCVTVCARICALTRSSYYVCWRPASDHHKRLRAIIFLWHFPIVVHNMSRVWRFMCGTVSIRSSYCTADEDMPLHIERSATTPRHFTFIRLRTHIDSTLTWNAHLIN